MREITAVCRQPFGSLGGGTRPMPRGYAEPAGGLLAPAGAAADHAAVPALAPDDGAAAVGAAGAVWSLDDASSDHDLPPRPLRTYVLDAGATIMALERAFVNPWRKET
jgi:hypothetical protein